MADYFFLSGDDRNTLRDMVADWRRRVRNTTGRPAPEDEGYLTPEVYLARTPAAGIPAMDANATGTGLDDEPGAAECDIYRVTDEGGAVGVARSSARQRKVYNLSESAIEGDRWLIVARTKDGKWLPLDPAGFGASRSNLKGKLNDVLYAGGKTTMSVWAWDGVYTGTGTDDSEESDTGEDVEVHDWMLSPGGLIPAGKKVIAVWVGGRYYVVGAQC